MASRVHLTSRTVRGSGMLVGVTPRQAGWRHVRFAVRQLERGRWKDALEGEEACLVLLQGRAEVRWGDRRSHVLGPRASVFDSYPHAVYLPPGARFSVEAEERACLADCRAPATRRLPARTIGPEDCGYEIRGGGNATRQIIDILPPAFPAERLMICEVLTPGGNWSSYPPHKHDTNALPREADLDETYYYRFRNPDGFGIQRLYGPKDRPDAALTVRDGDLVLIRDGYHPFVSAYGHDAYYLNVLAGTRRSMAASDDPRYAGFRARWPPPDARLPMVPPPYAPESRPAPAWSRA